jgi:hypothetical protein
VLAAFWAALEEAVDPSPRVVRLVLVRPDGQLLGSLRPYRVETPWWQDMGPVVRGARDLYGIGVTVLRMLETELPEAPGGHVTYLAETRADVALAPWHGTLDEHPLRHPYAQLGGPGADLAWADGVLREHGLARRSAAQVRTWNLSSLWCIQAGARRFWLKVVPPFFAHEGALLRRLSPGPVPRLLAHEGTRMLMAELPGDDLYEARLPTLLRMIDLTVPLQAAWSTRAPALLAMGLPDFRAPALSLAIADVLARTQGLSSDDQSELAALLDALPARFAQLDACGIADTLVHGDLYPGNFRGDDHELALLDWGDACVGHPLLDQSAFLERIPAELVETVRAHWTRAWRELVPRADPARAAALLAPVGAARKAVVYRRFLDRIEPAEHPYHQADPLACLRRAARLARAAR